MAAKKTLHLLIGSAGGVSGTFLIRHLLKNPIEGYQYHIVAVDSNAASIAQYFSSAFYQVPRVDDAGYQQVVYDIIEKEQIDIILPVTSYDIPFYAEHRVELAERGVRMLVCDAQTHALLNHKQKMYEFMQSIGIPVPMVYDQSASVRYPAIIKICQSSGSAGVHKLDDEADLRYWESKLEDYVITDYVRGREFTVDCLFDASGKLLFHNTRERKSVRGGGAVVAKNASTPGVIERILAILEAQQRIVGPVNFQYIRDDDGRVYVTDFNTRFASGGLPLTIASGFDIPNAMIQLMLNLPVTSAAKDTKPGLTMFRYYDELFVGGD